MTDMWKSLSFLMPAVTIVLLASLYAMSYFAVVSVEHSQSTGEAAAAYPGFVEPLSMVFQPMESIDRRVRTDLWSPAIVFDMAPEWATGSTTIFHTHSGPESTPVRLRDLRR